MQQSGKGQILYDKIIYSVVDHLKQEGFSSVRANCKGFTLPNQVKWDEEDEGVVPDITGEYGGSLYLFDVQTGDELDVESARDRWRLLSVHAKRYRGKFYLVVPEPEVQQLQQLIEDLDVRPGVLKLRGIEDA